MPDDMIQIVPFPRDPKNDKNFISNKIAAYMWVKGSDNGDVVKAWFNCNRLVNYDKKYTDVAKEKFLANKEGWSSEMYDLLMDFFDTDKFIFTYDYGYGLDIEMGNEGSERIMSLLYEGIIEEHFENWVQTKEEYYDIVSDFCKFFD